MGGEGDRLTPCSVSGPDMTVAPEAQMDPSNIGVEEGWVEEFTRVCSAHLPPDHPCLEYLKGQGLDLGVTRDLNKFTGNPSPLGGKRWYLAVSVKGRSGEFLIDTGASHSLISRKFYSLLPDEHDNFRMRVNACTADGSRMQTFGRTFLPLSFGGREYVFSPTVAEVNDDGILGLDFAALFGVVLDPSTGVLSVKHPYDVKVQCVLRLISSVASVVQTVKIPAGTACDVLCSSTRELSGQMAVLEPNMDYLSSRGLESADTLVGNAAWTVFLISNPGLNMIYLEKGTEVGQVIVAEAVTSSPPEMVVSDSEVCEELRKALEKVMEGSELENPTHKEALNASSIYIGLL